MASKPGTPVKASTSAADHSRLQRKIFGRWVAQKVSKRNIQVNDVVTDMSSGLLLIALMEELSEKQFTGKIEKNPKVKAQKIDNINQALKFTWDCGVEMKMKPSAEAIHDGNENEVLGLIWAIMLKYIKIGDDEGGESLSAKDALLLWAQNKIAGYKDVHVEKFGKDWHDGLAFGALIHRNRPKLISYDDLVQNKEKKLENLAKVQDAAEKYIGLEKYLTPEDVTKLDENSMVVYVSEFYYGIAEQRKLDLAAKRIGKVIKLTIENDAMKKQYNQTAKEFLERLGRVEKVLEDRTIDNTMAGAKKKIADFYNYKTNDKNVLLANQLDLEALYNNLAMKLSHHKRPEFIPDSNLTLKDVSKAINHLEECEQERKVALHNELNRQIRLVQLHEQHKSKAQQLNKWHLEKSTYLKQRETIESVSAAELQLRLLDAYDREFEGMMQSGVAAVKKLAQQLGGEKYERQGEVEAATAEIEKKFADLQNLSKEKRPVLDDALTREKFKEKVRGQNQEHVNNHAKLASWTAEKEEYLKAREDVQSVTEARTQLSLLEWYEKENQTTRETSVAELQALGKEILGAKYETQYSKWSIENPQAITDRESSIESQFATLAELSAEKRRVLDDHLAREEFKERVRMMNRNHLDRHNKLQSWAAEKATYLNTKENINSIEEARVQLSILEGFKKEKNAVSEFNVSQWKDLGTDILGQKYETGYSSYQFETPDEINARHYAVDTDWKNLDQLAAQKQKTLEGDLARELEKERLAMEFARQSAEFERWTRDTVEAVAAAKSQFGFTLEEVEAYKAELDKDNKHVGGTIATREKEFTTTYDAITTMKAQENAKAFTAATPASLASAKAALEKAVADRNAAYATELARQQANDKLCREFAAQANPFVEEIVKAKDAITSSKADLEEQLKFVNGKIAGLPKEEPKLKPLQETFDRIEAAGITNNKYTTYTAKDVEVQFQQYQNFLQKKAKMLEEEIEHNKLRGITQEQFNEIEATFKLVDSDKSGYIDKKELKACLYSLGEEKSRTEIDEIMKKYGSSDRPEGGINYNNFREFMIDLQGVSIGKEDILHSFKLINKGVNNAKVSELEQVMDEGDLKYFVDTSKKDGQGHDYVAWAEDIFSR
eukprot:TRINITY_DN179_c0_g1_i1.p1 TRINITY_DN179_c0_g1~~TRINITY_DN179_c0_g1_i1.p1  ORF type:complete len:1122 (-),score=548.09 TRINITY_DN179_c0_g1_i1:91-3456(-)